ncbi:hypothetical protein BDZ89DRAFT_182268 [Hymenopellis radicata]|nr:hypothetical protein BDZ89DRAFT_182268 [Hymenopellis radicata]
MAYPRITEIFPLYRGDPTNPSILTQCNLTEEQSSDICFPAPAWGKRIFLCSFRPTTTTTTGARTYSSRHVFCRLSTYHHASSMNISETLRCLCGTFHPFSPPPRFIPSVLAPFPHLPSPPSPALNASLLLSAMSTLWISFWSSPRCFTNEQV